MEEDEERKQKKVLELYKSVGFLQVLSGGVQDNGIVFCWQMVGRQARSLEMSVGCLEDKGPRGACMGRSVTG
ncbi:hypothetical protein Bpfe_021979 [Biomphalaria pfeifferi]|uniref:Uncharacterized protein n=1 Tax=Biomphalaria pfeifferi TaxID=112525 RepID=A0AAD8B5S1_BIOPF|nr:hypothetical protein Bpfe_021979 [Biomphalaria pfeifferi]